MKFVINRTRFLESIRAVQNIVPSKGSLPILQNVMIVADAKKLTLTTTDLDISIVSVCECEVLEPGSTTQPIRYLAAAVAKMAEGPVEVTVDGQEKATIIAGKNRLTLRGKSFAEFPKFEEAQDNNEYKLPRQTLFDMLRKTYYAASQDDTRRALKGVLLSFKNSKLTLVATDGRRLAMVENEVEYPANAECDIVLPSKSVTELLRSLNGEGEVIIRVQQGKICFVLGEVTIYSKLMEDPYPNYLQVIPNDCENKIEVDRQLLVDAIERASVMTMDEAHSIRMTFDMNMLTVSSASSEIGDALDEVPIKYSGERIEIVFNPNYVMDCLKAIDDDEVSFNMKNGHAPAIIRCSIPFLYVIMPLRTN